MPELFRALRNKENVHWVNALPVHTHLDSVRWYEEEDPLTGATLCHVFTVILRPFRLEDREQITESVMDDVRKRVTRIIEGLKKEGYPLENMRMTDDCLPLVLGVGTLKQSTSLALVIRRMLLQEWGVARRNRLQTMFGLWRRGLYVRRAADHWMDRCMRPEDGAWFKMCKRRFKATANMKT